MFPISDGRRPGGGGGIAWVTIAIVVLNALVFIFELTLGSGLETFVRTYGAVPREILTGQDLPPAGPNPLWIQLLTSMFIHGGWLHIISNMAYLRVFGDDIEHAFGSIPYLLFYLSTGVVASLTHIYLSGPASTVPSVGASGAIAGVLGAYIVLYPTRQVHVWLPAFIFVTTRISAFIMIGIWFILQFMNGLAALSERTAETGGVAVWAHIGGFVAGLAIALVARGLIGLRGRSYA